ncbi:MAG: PASTA domain-containing protein [Gammaproteobacteria bacterium]
MTKPVEITQPSDFVSCDDKRKATVVFNVTDITGQEAKLGVKVIADAPAQDDWFTLQTDSIWKLGANATDQITVNINVPDSAAPGKYNFRLMVYSVSMPGELFTKGETVCCEVKEIVVPPPPPPFRWWLVAVAVVVLALGGWGIWALTRDKAPVMVPLPDVVTHNTLAAQQKLAAAGLQLDLENSTVEPTEVDSVVGTVVKQSPDPKVTKEVEKGSKVSLVVAVKKPARVDPRWRFDQKLRIFGLTKSTAKPEPAPKPKLQIVKPMLKTVPRIGITREVEEAAPSGDGADNRPNE